MDVVPANTLCAVPDSAFPFSSSELGGLAGLLDPLQEQSPLGDPKSALTQGGEGYPSFPMSHPDYSYYEWMSESTDLLLTPEEQESDILAFHPHLTASFLPPSSSSYSLPTPEASAPSTPSSSTHYQQDSDLLDALSLIGEFSPASSSSPLNQSSEVLPQFDGHSPLPSPLCSHTTSVAYSPYNPTTSNANSFLLSPPSLTQQELITTYPLSVPSEPSPLPPDNHHTRPSSIVQLLVKDIPNSVSSDKPLLEVAAGSAGKRRNEEDTASERKGGKGKRRKMTKVAKTDRKKEQNKKAALRYRQRKRGETEDVEEKRERLEEHNAALKRQVEELTSKINYLKEVWRDVAAARMNSKQ